jgi:4-amino-4-deoxy-L-arabinose transferase-like glycosyltransferase
MNASEETGRFVSVFARTGQQLARRPSLILLPLLPLLLAVPYVAPWISPTLYGDESGYLRLAENIVHGHYLTGRNDEVTGGSQYPNLWFGPGLPLVMVPFVAVHLPLSVIRLLGPVFLFLAAVLFFRLLRLYVSTRAAALGAAALALYVPFYTALEHLHSETLSVLLIVATMYGTQRYLHEGRLRHLVLAGAALGWLALTRVAFGWIVTALLVLAAVWWAARRGTAPRRFTTVCCLALIVCVPWLAYTYSVTKQPLYWGSSGALSLYWMTSPYPAERGDWQQARAVFTDARLAPHRPFFRSLIGRPLVDQNDTLLHAAFANIRHRPARYARNVLANISRMWFDFPYSFRQERMAPLLFVIPNAVVLTALLASVALLVRRPGLLPVEAIPFGLFALTTFALHALLAAYPRMLFPIIPVIIWFVVLVMTRCIRVVPHPSVA